MALWKKTTTAAAALLAMSAGARADYYYEATILSNDSAGLGQYTLSDPALANFTVLSESFATLLGSNASIELIYNASEPLFHEGPVYNATGDTLYVSSNRITLGAGEVDESTSNQTIKLTEVRDVSAADASTITVAALDTSTIRMPNGGVAHLGASGMLFCAQGTKTAPSGIYSIPDPLNAPNQSFPVVTGFLGGREFNSPNDVVVNPVDNGTIWFTDPNYGSKQGIRNAPQLPTQVYRYDPATNSTRVVANGFEEPNGLAFNADFTTLYITDANNDDANPGGPATIYAFDVVTNQPGTFLTNKRVFAFSPKGIPDGIKVDAAGNVWSGVGSGVAVWNPAGDLIGEISIDGGAANFGFGATESTIFVLGETMLWRVQIA